MTSMAGVLAAGQGDTFSVGPDRITIKARSAHDRFTLVEYDAAAGAMGPPVHRHGVLEETFYLLEGVVDFLVGDRTMRVEAGGTVFVPAGSVHTFKVGATAARWLGIFSPGTGVEMLQALGTMLREGPPDPARLTELFAAHDTEVLGPPLG